MIEPAVLAPEKMEDTRLKLKNPNKPQFNAPTITKIYEIMLTIRIIFPPAISMFPFLPFMQAEENFYSVRSATTGSFFAAALAGIKPLIIVKDTLTATMIRAEPIGNDASVVMPVSVPKMPLTSADKR